MRWYPTLLRNQFVFSFWEALSLQQQFKVEKKSVYSFQFTATKNSPITGSQDRACHHMLCLFSLLLLIPLKVPMRIFNSPLHKHGVDNVTYMSRNINVGLITEWLITFKSGPFKFRIGFNLWGNLTKLGLVIKWNSLTFNSIFVEI